MSAQTEVIILAAGLGKRMKSDTIKILHRAGGRAIIDYVLDLGTALATDPPVMVIGRDREAVRSHCGDRARYVVQEEQLGTGHAVLQAAQILEKSATGKRIVILSGDAPLTRKESIQQMIDEHSRRGAALTLLSMRLAEPARYGRIVRDEKGEFVRNVEARDASPAELEINEVNGGIYVVEGGELFAVLRRLSTDNAQQEYYLTDIIELMRADGKLVVAHPLSDPMEALGVNSRGDLAQVEKILTERTIERLMEGGVTFRNPEAVLVDGSVTIDQDTVVYPFVTLEGKTVIGRNCVIESGSHLRNCVIGDHVTVKTGTVADDARIESRASVGPYSHLRAGTVLGPHVKVGNFVETKKAVFGERSKASHLSYIGDAEVGADVNIGAGTITCNYDGVNKHKTVIEDGVFIGSDSQLVAPIRVGKGAYVGAGSTVTKDVPADSLALSRTPQRTIEGWAVERRKKTKK